MNPIRKIYFRIFQTAFRAVMPFLLYRDPEISDSVGNVSEVLKRLDIYSVLLVNDSQLRSFGVTAALEESLREQGIKCAVYN